MKNMFQFKYIKFVYKQSSIIRWYYAKLIIVNILD